MVRTAVNVVRSDGVRGHVSRAIEPGARPEPRLRRPPPPCRLYDGLSASLLRNMLYGISRFAAYDIAKAEVTRRKAGPGRPLGLAEKVRCPPRLPAWPACARSG